MMSCLFLTMILPKVQMVTENRCCNDSAFVDIDGLTCAAYAQLGFCANNMVDFGIIPEIQFVRVQPTPPALTAVEACCACGGGVENMANCGRPRCEITPFSKYRGTALIPSFSVADIDECEAACMGNQRCYFFDSSRTNVCSLYASGGLRVQAKHKSSGYCAPWKQTSVTITTSSVVFSTITTETHTSDPCDGVICSAISQCHIQGICVDGVCTNPTNDGAICDDGIELTEDDKCNGGVCAGVTIVPTSLTTTASTPPYSVSTASTMSTTGTSITYSHTTQSTKFILEASKQTSMSSPEYTTTVPSYPPSRGVTSSGTSDLTPTTQVNGVCRGRCETSGFVKLAGTEISSCACHSMVCEHETASIRAYCCPGYKHYCPGTATLTTTTATTVTNKHMCIDRCDDSTAIIFVTPGGALSVCTCNELCAETSTCCTGRDETCRRTSMTSQKQLSSSISSPSSSNTAIPAFSSTQRPQTTSLSSTLSSRSRSQTTSLALTKTLSMTTISITTTLSTTKSVSQTTTITSTSRPITTTLSTTKSVSPTTAVTSTLTVSGTTTITTSTLDRSCEASCNSTSPVGGSGGCYCHPKVCYSTIDAIRERCCGGFNELCSSTSTSQATSTTATTTHTTSLLLTTCFELCNHVGFVVVTVGVRSEICRCDQGCVTDDLCCPGRSSMCSTSQTTSMSTTTQTTSHTTTTSTITTSQSTQFDPVSVCHNLCDHTSPVHLMELTGVDECFCHSLVCSSSIEAVYTRCCPNYWNFCPLTTMTTSLTTSTSYTTSLTTSTTFTTSATTIFYERDFCSGMCSDPGLKIAPKTTGDGFVVCSCNEGCCPIDDTDCSGTVRCCPGRIEACSCANWCDTDEFITIASRRSGESIVCQCSEACVGSESCCPGRPGVCSTSVTTTQTTTASNSGSSTASTSASTSKSATPSTSATSSASASQTTSPSSSQTNSATSTFSTTLSLSASITDSTTASTSITSSHTSTPSVSITSTASSSVSISRTTSATTSASSTALSTTQTSTPSHSISSTPSSTVTTVLERCEDLGPAPNGGSWTDVQPGQGNHSDTIGARRRFHCPAGMTTAGSAEIECALQSDASVGWSLLVAECVYRDLPGVSSQYWKYAGTDSSGKVWWGLAKPDTTLWGDHAHPRCSGNSRVTGLPSCSTSDASNRDGHFYIVGPTCSRDNSVSALKMGATLPRMGVYLERIYAMFVGGRYHGARHTLTIGYTDGSSTGVGGSHVPHDCGGGCGVGSWCRSLGGYYSNSWCCNNGFEAYWQNPYPQKRVDRIHVTGSGNNELSVLSASGVTGV